MDKHKIISLFVLVGFIILFLLLGYVVGDKIYSDFQNVKTCEDKGMEFGGYNGFKITCIEVGPNNEIIREVKFYDK